MDAGRQKEEGYKEVAHKWEDIQILSAASAVGKGRNSSLREIDVIQKNARWKEDRFRLVRMARDGDRSPVNTACSYGKNRKPGVFTGYWKSNSAITLRRPTVSRV